MATSTCRFCGVHDNISHLVEACGCHKKSDAALCHKSCLEAYIETRRQSDRDSVSAAAVHCPSCKEEFRVKLRWKWSTARYLSSTSVSQYFNLGMILVSTLCFFYAVYRAVISDEVHGEGVKRGMGIMAGVVGVMGLFVIWTLYKRWRRHQLNAEVIEIV